VTGGQLLPGKVGKTADTDTASIAGPVFLAEGDFLSTQCASQDVPFDAAKGVVQSGYLLGNIKI